MANKLPLLIVLNAIDRPPAAVAHAIAMQAYKKSYQYPFPQSGLAGDLFAEAEIFYVAEGVGPKEAAKLAGAFKIVPQLKVACYAAEGTTPADLALSGAADIAYPAQLGDALRLLGLIGEPLPVENAE